MRFNVITNLAAGCGLHRDYQLLRLELERLNHFVCGVQFNHPQEVPHADVNLFLETVVPKLFEMANQQWVMPNPEWWLPEYHACLPNIHYFLCKTQDSLRLFTSLVGDRATYVGFLSYDLYRPEIMRELRFLHVAGKSSVKNTNVILDAWREIPFPLALVTNIQPFIQQAATIPTVTAYPWLEQEDLTQLSNRCQFHLCPSQYEGFGHYLHEALGVGALVITTDAPPMNENKTPPELLLPAMMDRRLHLATMWRVRASHIVEVAQTAMNLPPDQIVLYSRAARQTFQHGCDEFQARFTQFIKDNTCSP